MHHEKCSKSFYSGRAWNPVSWWNARCGWNVLCFLLIEMALGAVIALIGVMILDVEKRREEKRKADFNMIRRKDKLDADVEFLGEFEDKK